MTTKYYLTGGTCHFDFGELKDICRVGRETERKGMKKRILIFVQCF